MKPLIAVPPVLMTSVPACDGCTDRQRFGSAVVQRIAAADLHEATAERDRDSGTAGIDYKIAAAQHERADGGAVVGQILLTPARYRGVAAEAVVGDEFHPAGARRCRKSRPGHRVRRC